MKFSEIQAHEDVKRRLTRMVDDNHLPHALLLHGRPGIGKFMMARALAQYIHCQNRQNGDSCGKCPACIQHQSLNHVDTYYSFPIIKAKGNISDDCMTEWREFLAENPYMNFRDWQAKLGNANAQPMIYVNESAELMRKLSFTTNNSRYMVVILWLPEKMNAECSNKQLKLIEEPFPDTLFIFVSDNPSAILSTIYSRLQRIEMKRLPDNVVAHYLTANYSVDEVSAGFLAHMAEGSIQQAVESISTSDESAEMFKLFVKLMRDAYQKKILELRKWAAEVADMGREKSMRFMSYCERLIGENYIFNLRNNDLIYLTAEEFNFSKNFARFINERNVLQLRRLFIDARTDIAGNTNAKMVTFDIAVKVILLLK